MVYAFEVVIFTSTSILGEAFHIVHEIISNAIDVRSLASAWDNRITSLESLRIIFREKSVCVPISRDITNAAESLPASCV